jgi:hypothetical protein
VGVQQSGIHDQWDARRPRLKHLAIQREGASGAIAGDAHAKIGARQHGRDGRRLRTLDRMFGALEQSIVLVQRQRDGSWSALRRRDRPLRLRACRQRGAEDAGQTTTMCEGFMAVSSG